MWAINWTLISKRMIHKKAHSKWRESTRENKFSSPMEENDAHVKIYHTIYPSTYILVCERNLNIFHLLALTHPFLTPAKCSYMKNERLRVDESKAWLMSGNQREQFHLHSFFINAICKSAQKIAKISSWLYMNYSEQEKFLIFHLRNKLPKMFGWRQLKGAPNNSCNYNNFSVARQETL